MRKTTLADIFRNHELELRHILGEAEYYTLISGYDEEETGAIVSKRIAQWILDVKGAEALTYFLGAARAVMADWDPNDGLIPGPTIRLNAEASKAFIEMLENAADTPEALKKAAREYQKWQKGQSNE
jgi:hypothetical protein